MYTTFTLGTKSCTDKILNKNSAFYRFKTELSCVKYSEGYIVTVCTYSETNIKKYMYVVWPYKNNKSEGYQL